MAHPIFCDVCNIGVSSEMSMRDHVKGRRHQQTLGAMERRKALARTSLYCHGFPPSIPTAELRSYFQHFGIVTRIMVETQKGCYCIVQYDSEAPVQKALNQRNHQLHGCSLTVRPRKPITTQRRPPEGERSQRKAKAAREGEEQMESSHEQLMSSLLQADSVVSQMEMLYETMRLSDADLDRRKKVCEYLHSVLSPFFPTCTIHQFGSSVNGFGMKGCDMDIFLDLHDTDVSLQWEETLRHKLKPVNLPYIREIQSLKTTEGPLLPSQLRQLSLVHRVKLMSRILMQHAPQCMDVLFVPSVRCPIVRFVHSPTGIKCDLSINNRLALRNTQLLKMCAEDRRVRLLVFAVRYWGKWKQVAGNQNCGPRLSNYCLSLLVLFYLANTSPPVLPSVQSLADLTDPAQKFVIEDWDCSLPEAVPTTTNTQSADELLHQFFQFYHEVSLSTNVILTRAGTVMPLNDFLLEKVNSPHLNDFKVKALAVQDPFVLQHNIAQNLNNQVRDLLIEEIDYAAAKTSTWSPADSATSSATSNAQTSQSTDSQTSKPLWGLPYLFSAEGCTPPTLHSSSPATTTSSWCEAGSNRTKTSSQWTYPVSLDLATLSPHMLQAMQAKGDYRAVWFRRVHTLLVWALREVFLFTVKMDKGGGMVAEGELDEDAEGEEHMCVEDDGGGTSSEPSRAGVRSDSEDGNVSQLSAEDQNVGIPSPEHQKATMSCLKYEGRLPPNVDDPACSKPSGSQESMMTDHSPTEGLALSINPGPACARMSVEGEERGVSSSAGAGEEGGVQSPHSEHSSSMHSPGEASPMAVSELCHLSPGCEGKRSSSLTEASAVQSHVTAQQSLLASHPSNSEPCSRLGESEKTFAQGSCVVKAEQNTSEHCDVEMIVDLVTVLPTSSQVDSSAAPENGRDLPHACSVGEAASERSVLPLRVEFSPVGDGKVFVSAKDDPSACLSKAAVQNTHLLNTESKSPQTPPNKSMANNSTKNKKCKPVRFHCEGKYKAWYGRKATRSNLIAEGHVDDLELEKLISKKIAERDAGSTAPPLKFYCTLSPVAKGERPEAEISFEPAESLPKEFSVFPTFFKSYFTKLVSKNLPESSTV